MALVDRSVKNRPFIAFRTADTLEQATAKATEMEAFFKDHMDAGKVAGLRPFCWAAAIFAKQAGVGGARASAIGRGRESLSGGSQGQARRGERSRVDAFRRGAFGQKRLRLHRTAQIGSYRDTKTVDSSMKAALKLLRDLKRPLIEVKEKPFDKREGKILVEIVLARGGPKDAELWIEFVAPPLSVLKTGSELGREIADPKTPKKTIKARIDTI